MKNKTIFTYLIVAFSMTILLVTYLFSHNFLYNDTFKIEKVKKIDFIHNATFQGIIESSKIYPIYIESPAIIENVLVREGSFIKKGEPLIVFSKSSSLEIKNLLKMNELDLEESILKLDNLENGIAKFELDTKSLEIKNIEDQIKASNRKIPILVSEVQLLRKRANALVSLYDMGGISSLEMGRATTEASKKEAELEDLKMSLDLLKQRYQLTFLSYEGLKRDIKIQKLRLKSPISKLKLTQGELQKKYKELSDPLLAPIDGIILKLDVTSGSNPTSGSRLLSIAEVGSEMVIIKIPLSEVHLIENAEKIEIFSDEQSKKPIIGKINRISNIANQSTVSHERVVDVEIALPQDNNLTLGLNVNIDILGASRKNILVVKPSSIVFKDDIPYIYIIKDGKPTKYPINLGEKTDTDIEVFGLEKGTKYIVNPDSTLDNIQPKQ